MADEIPPTPDEMPMPPESTAPPEDAAPPATLVYLDADDEITSAAARIRTLGTERVALVLPYGSRLATSRINFRLLAREATERGKRIEIICADASARALAQAAGLPVHASVAAFEGRVPAGTAPAGSSGPAGDALAVGNAEPAGAVRDPGSGRAGPEPDADDTQTRVLALPRRSAPRVPIVGPPRPPMRPRLAIALGAALIVLAVVGAFLAVEVLPSATIVLHPRSEEIGPIQFTVNARPDVTAPDSEALVVPAQPVTYDLTASSTFTATGVKVVETKATGNVTFSNLDTGGSNQISAGAIVRTRSGEQFRTLADVTLPPAFLFPFFPSTASVAVEAVAAGLTGNVDAKKITVIPSGENKRLLEVTNQEATSGGEERQATEVSQRDVDTAKAAIEAALAKQLDERVSAAGGGEQARMTMFPETAVVGEVTYAVDPATLVGTEVLEFELSATARGSALGVDPEPIIAMAESRLEARVPSGWTLVPGSAAVVGTPAVIGSEISYPVEIRGTIVHDVDQVALLASIRGLVLADARARLDDYGDVEITLWPDWVTKIPTRVDRVTFTVGDPQPSPTP